MAPIRQSTICIHNPQSHVMSPHTVCRDTQSHIKIYKLNLSCQKHKAKRAISYWDRIGDSCSCLHDEQRAGAHFTLHDHFLGFSACSDKRKTKTKTPAMHARQGRLLAIVLLSRGGCRRWWVEIWSFLRVCCLGEWVQLRAAAAQYTIRRTHNTFTISAPRTHKLEWPQTSQRAFPTIFTNDLIAFATEQRARGSRGDRRRWSVWCIWQSATTHAHTRAHTSKIRIRHTGYATQAQNVCNISKSRIIEKLISLYERGKLTISN